jgi:energy-coupling factor transport system ATP-binding protein
MEKAGVAQMDPLALLDDFGFTYEGEKQPALQGIHLEIRPGELVLLCGPTGCGKTSLALCFNGLVPYAAPGKINGSIQVCGVDPTKTATPHMATHVGLVFQDPESQLCTLFLEDEIAFGPENLKICRKELEPRVTCLLEQIGLLPTRYGSVFELSGGQKQKVNIASVLAMQPGLLIFDMPTANLDPIGSAEVFAMIRRLATETDAACIVIENRLDDLVPLADRVVVMDMSGGIEYDGSPAEVFAHGKDIVERIGVEIPQVVELGLALNRSGFSFEFENGMPLTIREAVSQINALFQAGKLKPLSRLPTKTNDRVFRGGAKKEQAIVLEDVRFSYRKGKEVLKGISFSMEKGELLTIVGNNGSGKTTLAKQLVGLLRPTGGRVRVCGLDASRANLAEISARAAYVFQYPEHQFVAQGKAVYDEIAFNLRAAGRPEPEIEARVQDLIERFQLCGKEHTSPYMLSGGEMRTLSVACMLSTDPELLILDEPTYGQDRRRITALMERLAELRQSGTSIIMISHDMRLVAEYADRVVLMNDGQMLFHGPPADLFARPDLLRKAALKEPPVCAIARELRSLGVPLPQGILSVPDFMDALDE